MPRGIYDRTKTNKTAETPAEPKKKRRRRRRKNVNVLALRATTGGQLKQTTEIPDSGIVQRIVSKGGAMLVTLDITPSGISVYPSHAKRNRKSQPRISWENFSRITAVISQFT